MLPLARWIQESAVLLQRLGSARVRERTVEYELGLGAP